MFKIWLLLQEMASFSVPPTIVFSLPGDTPGKHLVGAIDMRFEDWMPALNQGSNFAAKIPGSNTFLVWHGAKQQTEMMGPNDIPPDYTQLPNDWWTHAQVFDRNYDVVRQPPSNDRRAYA